MTPEEIYLFDIQGYLYIENVLDENLLSKLLYLVSLGYVDLDKSPKNPDAFRRDSVLADIPVFRRLLDLIDLKDLYGGKRYRVDHDYLQMLKKGTWSQSLHGGGTPYDTAEYYSVRDGSVFNGLISVAFNLTPTSVEEGGFVCIPGSHKSNFPTPDRYKKITPDNSLLQPVPCKAGSAIVMTEALTHGTMPWTGATERLTYFIKYAPKCLAWSSHRYTFKHPLVSEPSDLSEG